MSLRKFLYIYFRKFSKPNPDKSANVPRVVSLFRIKNHPSSHRREEIKRKIHLKSWAHCKQASCKNITSWTTDDQVKLINRSKGSGLNIISLLQTVPNSCSKTVTNHVKRVKDNQKSHTQEYQPERVKVFGPDLAAIHFFIDRRAAVRLIGHVEWMTGCVPKFADEDILKGYSHGWCPDEEYLTNDCRIEAIDCSNFNFKGINFEGLKYLTGLLFLKTLLLKNQNQIDVWCLDRLAGQNGKSIEYLDISDCDLDIGCIIALSKMNELKMLIVKNPEENTLIKTALCELMKEKPNLTVQTVSAKGMQTIEPPSECAQNWFKNCIKYRNFQSQICK